MDAQYFSEIQDPQTYKGEEEDFHYEYNANSGGGQAFLAGFKLDKNGSKKQTSNLSGRLAFFAIGKELLSTQGEPIEIDTDEGCLYPVVPRGSGSNQLKLSVQQKTRPSLAIAAFFMLPRTCVKNSSINTACSPLTRDNFWLESMWMDYEERPAGRVALIPKDFIFSGGVATAAKKKIGSPKYFRLNGDKRITDILSIELNSCSLPDAVKECIAYFQNIYNRTFAFNFNEAQEKISILMETLAELYPQEYSGYSDPLPFIIARTIGNFGIDKKSQTVDLNMKNVSRNLIYFGAPGTGKSYELNSRASEYFDPKNTRRVTFYPEYSYSQFAGTYKPVSKYDESNGRSEITYSFVLGPFMESLIDAIDRPHENHLFIIEEINRANPGAVFGDIFQLLDRDAQGISEYTIDLSQELGEVLYNRLSSRTNFSAREISRKCVSRIALPSNFFIWATMNSADQGVFPMDSAFKRRWDFKYLHIDSGSDLISDIEVPIGPENKIVRWDQLRRSINDLLTRAKVEEDRLIGPFFIPPASFSNPDMFQTIFKEKVLLYIFEDIAKTKREKIFAPDVPRTYSGICSQFDAIGENIFADLVHADEVLISGNLSDSARVDPGVNDAGLTN